MARAAALAVHYILISLWFFVPVLQTCNSYQTCQVFSVSGDS